VFLGDDRTDEIAFASVNEDGGVSVRVGEGETVAGRRLADPAEVRALLAAWAEGAPIDPDALPTA
jgi:trehalose 6-phosphate phosphatase